MEWFLLIYQECTAKSWTRRNSALRIMDSPLDVNTGKSMVKSVLVVDDEQNFVNLLDWYLSKRGYEVRTALNGDEALKLVEKRFSRLSVT